MTILEFYREYPKFKNTAQRVDIYKSVSGQGLTVEIDFFNKIYQFSLQDLLEGNSSSFSSLYAKAKNIENFNRNYTSLLFTDSGIWTCDINKKPISPTSIKFDGLSLNNVRGIDLNLINENSEAVVPSVNKFFCYGCNTYYPQNFLNKTVLDAKFCNNCGNNEYKELREAA